MEESGRLATRGAGKKQGGEHGARSMAQRSFSLHARCSRSSYLRSLASTTLRTVVIRVGAKSAA